MLRLIIPWLYRQRKRWNGRKHKYERPAGMVRANTEVDSLADKKIPFTGPRCVVCVKPDEQQSYQYKEQKMLQKDSLDKRVIINKMCWAIIVNTFLFGRTLLLPIKKAGSRFRVYLPTFIHVPFT